MKVEKVKLIIIIIFVVMIIVLKIDTKKKMMLEVSTDKYENIVSVSKEVNFFKEYGGYIYKNNTQRIKTDYKEVKKISDHYLLVKNTLGIYKLIDINNHEVSLPENDQVVSISDNRYILLKLRDEYFYFDLVTGKEISSVYKKLGDFQEGMAMFVRDKKIGYIDIDGKEIIKNQFDSAGNFLNGYAIVKNKSEKYRYIDKNGNISTKEYDFIKSYEGGKLLLNNGEKNILKYKENEVVTKNEIVNIGQDFYLFKESDLRKSKIYSTKKNIFIKELDGNYIGVVGESILLEKKNKIVVYNLKNQEEKELNLEVKELENYKNDYFIKRENNKSYLYNNNGKKLSIGYSLILSKVNGRLIVANENGFGVISDTGNEILECKYDSIQLTPDYIIVEINDKKSLYNNKGKIILRKSYENIIYVNESLYIYDVDGWRYIL